MDEVLEFINLIQKSGHSILELADEILSIDKPVLLKEAKLNSDEFNQISLKEKLLKLYVPQAINKKVNFEVITNANTQGIPFSKNKLLQIVGNLISNSMKFTPAGGSVTVNLGIDIEAAGHILQIKVEDTGVGMTADKITQILNGKGETTEGTSGEQGYGFGLALVKHLVDNLKGAMQITSQLGNGTVFTVSLPQSSSKR